MCCGEAGLEALEEVEGGVGHGGMQVGVVEGIGVLEDSRCYLGGSPIYYQSRKDA